VEEFGKNSALIRGGPGSPRIYHLLEKGEALFSKVEGTNWSRGSTPDGGLLGERKLKRERIAIRSLCQKRAVVQIEIEEGPATFRNTRNFAERVSGRERIGEKSLRSVKVTTSSQGPDQIRVSPSTNGLFGASPNLAEGPQFRPNATRRRVWKVVAGSGLSTSHHIESSAPYLRENEFNRERGWANRPKRRKHRV